MKRPLFTLREARAMLPALFRLTVQAMDELEAALNSEDPAEAATAARKVERWVSAIDMLGGVAHGLWEVDFDNGQGFYSWSFPETDVDHFRTYDAGFDRRTPIQ